MIRPPPRSTLFPSPTLFRSLLLSWVLLGTDLLDGEERDPDRSPAAQEDPPGDASEGASPDPSEEPSEEPSERSEEHTSELQSANISYAVFCLKKKKNVSRCY